jgi:hypothetical protein
MRALVALVVIALVALAVDAQIAAAGLLQPKKPGVSVSVDAGSASVDADVSTDDAGASMDVSTPSTSGDVTVDSSPTEAPASAAVEASTPVGDAAVDATASSGDANAGNVGVRLHARASSHVGSVAIKADSEKGIEASREAKTPLATGGGSEHVTVVAAAAPAAPNERSPAVAARLAKPAALPAPHRERTPASLRPSVHFAPTVGPEAPWQPLATEDPIRSSLSRAIASPWPPTKPAFAAAAPAESMKPPAQRGPVPAPASSGESGSSGPGPPTAAFFAILTAFLMLAAPLVGRWLRPTDGPALQPAFTSLPERPG